MLKNMFKRTWLSIIRKPSKSVVLILLMFVMANLVLSSLLIKNAVNENIEAVKESLGSEIYLSADMSSIMNNMSKDMESREPGTEISGMGSQMMIERPVITLSTVLEIGDSIYVNDLTYSANSSAYAVDFNAVESSSDFGFNSNRPSQGNMQVVGDVTIEGINAYAFISGVDTGAISIYDGTYFDESTDNQIMISYELALENDLEVGDLIILENIEDEENYELEIIGIFTSTDSGYENTIYMNVQTASNFFTSNSFTDDGDYIVSNVVYYLTNPDYSDDFLEEANIKFPNLEEDNLVLDINNQAYEAMAGSVEQVGEFADTTLIIVIGASILIITLLINNNVKDRVYEIGVLSALGASKKNIAGQIFMELIITATVGFILSFATSYFFANTISQSLLDNQNASQEVSAETSFGRPSSGTGGGTSNMPGMNMEQGSNSLNQLDVEAIDEIHIEVSLISYILLFIIGYLVAFIAMILPTINIVKYEPKTILTGRQ